MSVLYHKLIPIASDYTGVLNAISAIEGCFAIMHGPHGCANFYGGTERFLAGLTTNPFIANAEIEEEDVTLGGDDRVINAVKEIDERFAPRLIVIVATPVSSLMGTDLVGIARQIQPQVKARLAVFEKGGFGGDYTVGESDAFSYLAAEVVQEPKNRVSGVNLLGTTRSNPNWRSDLQEIRRILNALHIPVISSFTIDGKLDEISRAAEASLNLVLSESGIEAASILEHRFGTPSVMGMPFGLNATTRWVKAIADRLGLHPDRFLAKERRYYWSLFVPLMASLNVPKTFLIKVAVIGPLMYSQGLAAFLNQELGLEISVLASETGSDKYSNLYQDAPNGTNILTQPSEEELAAALRQADPDIVFGDSNYLNLWDSEAVLVPIAKAGRIYDCTPYVGFRGGIWLTQVIADQMASQEREWLRGRYSRRQ